MALLAEEIVEEWLNRQGYFTIRGIKLGVHEIDILAIKINDKEIICRHFEVQASMRPVSYISSVPKSIRKITGKASGSAKERNKEELSEGVKEWVKKKYLIDKKCYLREMLYPGNWSFELVVHKIRHPEEIVLIANEGVLVHNLIDIIKDLSSSNTLIESAAGASLADLVLLDKESLL